MAEEIITLKEFDSLSILPFKTYDAGVYNQKLSIRGNSIISKVFVESMDVGASVQVFYHDYGVGYDEGEYHPLASHEPIVAASPYPSHILISNFNDKPIMTAVVTGGRVRFGVYITVTTAASTDVDNALQKEADVVDLGIDKGLPIAVFDEKNGVWRFARGELGIQDVRIVGNVAVGEPGFAYFQDASAETTPGIEQSILTHTVPDGSNLNLLSIQVVCRRETSFQIYGDGELIGSGRTGAATPQVNFAYRIARTFESGKIVEVKATARAESSPEDIECYLQGTLSQA